MNIIQRDFKDQDSGQIISDHTIQRNRPNNQCSVVSIHDQSRIKIRTKVQRNEYYTA